MIENLQILIDRAEESLKGLKLQASQFNEEHQILGRKDEIVDERASLRARRTDADSA